MYRVKGLTSLSDLFQLEVNDHLNNRSSREVHANDPEALVQVRLGPQVVVQLCVDALSDGSGVCEHTRSTAEGEKNLGLVSCRCNLQVLIDALPFLLHMHKSRYLQGTANVDD